MPDFDEFGSTFNASFRTDCDTSGERFNWVKRLLYVYEAKLGGGSVLITSLKGSDVVISVRRFNYYCKKKNYLTMDLPIILDVVPG